MRSLLLDQGLSAPAAQALREMGWDALHVREIGMAEAEDLAILAYAAAQKRVLVTLDHDFPQILALTGAALPSVILIRRERLKTTGLIRLLEEIFDSYEHELAAGSVLSAGHRSTRVRLLPLR